MTDPADPPILDLSRLGPPAKALGALGVALGLLSAAWTTAADTLVPNRIVLAYMDPDRLEAQASRIAAVVDDRSQRGDERPVAVLLGQSTVREGVDVHALQRSHDTLCWVNLGASGGNLVQLEYYAQALLHSPLDPAVAILGIHVQFLAHPRPDAATQPDPSPGPLRALDVLGIWRDRQIAGNALRHRAGATRRAVARAFRWDYGVLFPDDRAHLTFTDDGEASPDDPYAAPRKYEGSHATDDRQAFLRQHAEGYGWFDPESYRTSSPEAHRLRALIEALDRGGAKLVVVLLPERSDLRSRIPDAAADRLDAVLQSTGVDLSVVDHRDWISDDRFFDHAHLNHVGRDDYTPRLAEALLPFVNDLR